MSPIYCQATTKGNNNNYVRSLPYPNFAKVIIMLWPYQDTNLTLQDLRTESTVCDWLIANLDMVTQKITSLGSKAMYPFLLETYPFPLFSRPIIIAN